MTLIKQIQTDKIQAMKQKDKEKVSTLNLLIAEIEKEMKLTGVAVLSEEKTETVISRQIKKLDKEIEAYQAVNRSTEKQEVEKELLLSYLPEQLTEFEIRNKVAFATLMVANGVFKNPMQYLSKELKGKADMGLVAKIVKEYQK